MQASMGLSYLSSITWHFLLDGFRFIFYCNENDLKFAMRCSTKFQRVVERFQRIREHIATAFQNNNSA